MGGDEFAYSVPYVARATRVPLSLATPRRFGRIETERHAPMVIRRCTKSSVILSDLVL